MTNSQELQRALKSFYCAKSLPPARVESLIRAKTQALLLSRQWRVKHLMPITALAAACAVCLFLWVRQEQQRATERAVRAEVVNRSPVCCWRFLCLHFCIRPCELCKAPLSREGRESDPGSAKQR
jgi:hypothetical protein